MIKLLVIADDFTGALDIGVQFKAERSQIRVITKEESSISEALNGRLQVLIVDAETRHLPPHEAYQIIYRIVSEAVTVGVPCIYKKTDSALRGNIGSELTAMLEASGQTQLHFAPAFPQMGRKTVGGIQYIGNFPVAESVFGADPFEPVRHSSVRDIIASQSNISVHLAGTSIPKTTYGVVVYDASTDQDLYQIAQQLKQRDQLRLLAGCAGFAAALPQLLELAPNSIILPKLDPRLVTVCGSINPITVDQLHVAEQAGMLRIKMTPQQKLDPDWLSGPEGETCICQWLAWLEERGAAIVECGVEDSERTKQYALQKGLKPNELRERIAQAMGSVLKKLLDRGLDATLLVTGGDTLLAFFHKIDQNVLIPIGELVSGVVLSQFSYRGKVFNLLSKSGGFGPSTVLIDLKNIISCS